MDGQLVKLRYYISGKPIDKEKAVEEMLLSFYEGRCEADASYCHGSSWTGVYARNDTFNVGGHSLTAELSSHVGKYCYLIIETEDQ